MQSLWMAATCATLLGGCSAVDGFSSASQGNEHQLDPTKVYLGPFDEIQTTRREIDQYRCLSGAPLQCEVIAITADCTCMY